MIRWEAAVGQASSFVRTEVDVNLIQGRGSPAGWRRESKPAGAAGWEALCAALPPAFTLRIAPVSCRLQWLIRASGASSSEEASSAVIDAILPLHSSTAAAEMTRIAERTRDTDER